MALFTKFFTLAPTRIATKLVAACALALMLAVGAAPDAQAQEDTVVVTITHVAPGAPGPASFFEFDQAISFDLLDGESFSFEVPVESFVSMESFDPGGYAATGLDCVGTEEAFLFADPIGNFIDLFVSDVDVDCIYTSSPVETVNVTFTKSAPESDGFDVFDFFVSDSFAFNLWDFSLADGESQTIEVPANEFLIVEELGLDGWALADITCDTASATSFGPFSWEVALTDVDATCVVTNQRTVQVEVTLTKRVTGFEGPVQFDWFDYVNFESRLVGPDESTTYLVDQNAILNIDEALEPGWSGESIVCDGNESFADIFDFGDGFASLSIGVADAPVSCEVTNSYQETVSVPLTITKAVDGGDGSEIFEFSVNDQFAVLADGESATFALAPFESVIIIEFGDPNWQASSISCVGADGFVLFAAPGFADFEVRMGDGPAECTVTNSAVEIVDLTIIHSSPDAPEPVLYSVFDEAGIGSDALLADGESAVFGVAAGNFFDVYVDNPAGQQLNQVDCDAGEIFDVFSDPWGSYVYGILDNNDATCTFTFGPPPTLRITKVTEGADNGQRFSYASSAGSFELGGGDSMDLPISDGFAWVAESSQPGWELVSIQCDADPNDWYTFLAPPDGGLGDAGYLEVYPSPGVDVIDCTFTNRPTAGVIAVGVESPATGDPALQLSGPEGTWTPPLGLFQNVSFTEPSMATFSLDLSAASQWTITGAECSAGLVVDDISIAASGRTGEFTVEVGPGFDGTCTFTVDLRGCSAPGQTRTGQSPRCRADG